MNVDSRAIASVTDITGLPVLRDFGFESRNLLTLYILTSCYILTCKRPHKAEIMAERKLIIHDGQPEDFQLAVTAVLELIESRCEKQESLLQNCKCLILFPSSYFGYKQKDITFVQLLNLVLEKKEDKLTYDHLWKVSDGFALVQDRISLITKPGEKLFNGRTITLLDHGLHDSCRRRLHYKLSSNVAICNQELSPPRNSNQVGIDKFSDSSLSSSLSDTLDGEKGGKNTPVDNCRLSSDCLMDFDDPPRNIPALEAKKLIKIKEGANQSREAHLDKIERDITARVAGLQARESDIDFHEQELNTRISAVLTRENDALEIDLEEREYDLDQREYSVEQGETANAEFEEITRTKITAGLKCRILDAESLEESIAIRNAALKEREERLDEREQLAVVDRKVLEVECAKAASRMDEIKIHKDMVKGAEALFQSREKAHEKIRDEFEARETLLGVREAAIKLRKDNAKENHFAFFQKSYRSILHGSRAC
ncbi:uncharacterized protein EAF01_011372 [Botrytis porri]|uniref:uncharacterized protein n=1 Tax=Botrytis porri TaxID=87229 RepID=UPI0019011A54|nr:uncharacterized protein EAF01_011372 [Botrytis porri]KAF7885307.1 hypothetical protein EAF01_011372 [Botrytis porri]